MGFAFTVIVFFLAGLLFLAGWVSINTICQCAPLTENVANGTLGLFCIAGAVVGTVLSVLFA